MMKKTTTIIKVLAISVLIFFVGLIAVLASVPPSSISGGKNTSSSLGGYTLTGGRSEKYSLEMDEETLAFRVTDKETKEVVMESGNILPDSEGYDNGLNSTWENFAKSAVTIYYTNERQYTPLAEFESVEIETEKTLDGFISDINIDDILLRFKIKVELIGDSIEVSIPFSSIKEKKPERNPLLSIAVYPFINSTKGVQVGAKDSYILVPDGSGALIDTSKKTVALNYYQTRVYGEDYGVNGNTAIKKHGYTRPPKKPLFPVFGMVSDGNGYMGEIVSGEEYADIRAYASGIVTDYNFVYSQFIYRENYYKPVDNAGNTVSVYQESPNKFDAKMTYTFLKGDDANYSGMANKYRESLENRKVFKTAVSGAVPLKADFLMADSFKDTFGRTLVPVTSAPFALSALKELKQGGVKSISSGISGYTVGGKTGASPRYASAEGRTGSSAEYKALFSYDGASVYPMANYVFVDNEISSYSKRDLVLSLTKEFIEHPYYEMSNFDYADFQVLNPLASKKYFDKDLAKFKSNFAVKGIQLSNMEMLLSSYGDDMFTRSEAKKAYADMLKSTDTRLSVDKAPSYLWESVKELTSSPMDGSRFIIALDSVPFLQMATGKYIDHFSSYVNLQLSGENDLLRMVDFNVYPSYLLTEKNSFELCFTPSSYIFSSQFSLWQSKIKDTYKRIEPVLKAVRGSAFICREQIASGVFKNTYENGAVVITNYSNFEYDYNGTKVAAVNFALGGNNG